MADGTTIHWMPVQKNTIRSRADGVGVSTTSMPNDDVPGITQVRPPVASCDTIRVIDPDTDDAQVGRVIAVTFPVMVIRMVRGAVTSVRDTAPDQDRDSAVVQSGGWMVPMKSPLIVHGFVVDPSPVRVRFTVAVSVTAKFRGRAEIRNGFVAAPVPTMSTFAPATSAQEHDWPLH